MAALLKATGNYPWPCVNVRARKLLALLYFLITQGEHYGFGSKIDPPSFVDPDKEVDCSGWNRWGIFHATKETGEALTIPDGSVNQHEWARDSGLKVSDVQSGKLRDGMVRLFFLPPKDDHPGHTGMIYLGFTLESHGGGTVDPRVLPRVDEARLGHRNGPDRREWKDEGWMAECVVYVLANALTAEAS